MISGATDADDTAIKNKVDVPQDVTPKAPDIGTTTPPTQPSMETASTSKTVPTVPDPSTSMPAPAATQPWTGIAPTNDTIAANEPFKLTGYQSIIPGVPAFTDTLPKGSLIYTIDVVNNAVVGPLVYLGSELVDDDLFT